MGESGTLGGMGLKLPRALGKAVVGPLLATAARRFRDREAFFCAGTGRRFTFRQTNERCNRLAHGWRVSASPSPIRSRFFATIAPNCRKSTMRSPSLDSSAFP